MTVYNGRPFEWDRPGVNLFDDGSIRIITRRDPDGSIAAYHKASDEEVRFIMTLESPFNRLVSLLRNEISHAAANDHRLGRDCQGIDPFAEPPVAVREDYIEACIEGALRS